MCYIIYNNGESVNAHIGLSYVPEAAGIRALCCRVLCNSPICNGIRFQTEAYSACVLLPYVLYLRYEKGQPPTRWVDQLI